MKSSRRRLRLRRWDVEEQAALRAVRLAEVPPPVETAEILWPERDGELEIDGDRHLGLDEVDPARLQVLCDLRHELLGKEKELRPQPSDSNWRKSALFLAVSSKEWREAWRRAA